MKIAVTGATGFLGRYIVAQLVSAGRHCRCWFRPTSDRSGMGHLAGSIEWVPGQLGDHHATEELLSDCDAVVHAALDYSQTGSRTGLQFDAQVAERNVIGTLQLIAVAHAQRIPRFVYISSCAVYDKILPERPLDETHPLWPGSHYGAHKAAIEAFVHSYGLGASGGSDEGFAICALRPTGIYGVAHPVEASKWYSLVRDVVLGRPVTCQRGGKEVHAADVARGVDVLLQAANVAGEAFNCYDRYVSDFEVAQLAKRISGSQSEIVGQPTQPRNQIVTDKVRALGVAFGGSALLDQTVACLVEAVRPQRAQSTL